MADLKRVYRHVVTDGPELATGDSYAVINEPSTVSGSTRATAAAGQLQAIFDRYPEADSVAVYVHGVRVGVALRDDYPAVPSKPEPPTRGTDHRSGEGDRAMLPGESQHYEAFRYTCPKCARPVYTTAARAPVCPSCQVPTS